MFNLFFGFLVFFFSSIALADGNAPAPQTPAPQTPAPQTPQHVMISKEELDRLIAKAAGKSEHEEDLTKNIEAEKKRKLQDQQTQEKIVTAAKFNIRLDTFLKEYSGVLPADANEIPKAASLDKYPGEVERSNVIKAALMQSFFKEDENIKLLSESQLAKWKTYLALGTVGRNEEAASVYDIVFEPAINHARSVRQAQLKSNQDTLTGSKDSDIIFKKMHEKQLRAIKANYPLNDVLHEQAKQLGLATAHS